MTLKSALDHFIAALGLIISAPILLLVAILVKLDTPGPAFYRRRVVGLHGKEFDALKLRTMVVNADEILRQNSELRRQFEKDFKLRDDPRVTRLGRFLRRTSIDELPQLINVLRGEMSLVGPRMISPAELHRYGEHAQKLLCVKPGMAGPWVAAGRQEIPYEQRVVIDLQYIDNWSLWSDIKILFATLISALTMRGAY